MKLKTKILFAALTVMATGPAAATIKGPSTGDGEMFFTIIDRDPLPNEDGDDSRSYTRDLGISISQFLPSPAGSGVTTPGHVATFQADQLLQSFLAGITDQARRANLVWNIGAMDSSGVNRFLTTALDILPSQIPTNQGLRTFDDNSAVFLDAVNSKPEHAGGADANGSSVSGVSEDSYGGRATWSINWGNSSSFSNAALIGQSTKYFLLSSNGGNGSNPATAALDKFDNAFGDATWTFNQDGTLVYMAPVPEPSEWALMAAGIALVGWAARRRRNAA